MITVEAMVNTILFVVWSGTLIYLDHWYHSKGAAYVRRHRR